MFTAKITEASGTLNGPRLNASSAAQASSWNQDAWVKRAADGTHPSGVRAGRRPPTSSGGLMAEVSKTDDGGRNPRYFPGVKTGSRGLAPRLERLELPETPSPAHNPALNRSAEVFGRGLGNAVAQVRRLPRRIDQLRSRIHLVPRRETLPEPLLELKDSAIDAATQWRDAAEDTLEEFRERAGSYTQEVAERTTRGWDDMQSYAKSRIIELRRGADRRFDAARYWQHERPLRAIAVYASIAFAAGVALRVWRSSLE